jgi:hypothetical protein
MSTELDRPRGSYHEGNSFLHLALGCLSARAALDRLLGSFAPAGTGTASAPASDDDAIVHVVLGLIAIGGRVSAALADLCPGAPPTTAPGTVTITAIEAASRRGDDAELESLWR